jgi:hypothetical protein
VPVVPSGGPLGTPPVLVAEYRGARVERVGVPVGFGPSLLAVSAEPLGAIGRLFLLGGTRTKGISKRSGARAGSVGRDHVFRKISDRGNIGRVELVEGQSSALELASEPAPTGSSAVSTPQHVGAQKDGSAKTGIPIRPPY